MGFPVQVFLWMAETLFFKKAPPIPSKWKDFSIERYGREA
jgi:hypothetical protein